MFTQVIDYFQSIIDEADNLRLIFGFNSEFAETSHVLFSLGINRQVFIVLEQV